VPPRCQSERGLELSQIAANQMFPCGIPSQPAGRNLRPLPMSRRRRKIDCTYIESNASTVFNALDMHGEYDISIITLEKRRPRSPRLGDEAKTLCACMRFKDCRAIQAMASTPVAILVLVKLELKDLSYHNPHP
jgi:hypothetical protein